ncbi:MAG: hypothetical protein ABEH90_04545 [Halolamina sp.]
MELDWTIDTVGGVTLVRVRLGNERSVERRVRLRNRLDGPVLPPRREKEPEAGWDREGVTTVVPAAEAVALGYACPAPPAEPPVETVDIGSPSEAEPEDPAAGEAIRRLGDARPPRAVLGGEVSPDDGSGEAASTLPTENAGADTVNPAGGGEETGRKLPSEAAALLDPYRRRVETLEALGVASVPEATEILDASSGVDGIEQTGARLTDDAAELETLAAEAAALAARARAVTPPTDALRRLS